MRTTSLLLGMIALPASLGLGVEAAGCAAGGTGENEKFEGGSSSGGDATMGDDGGADAPSQGDSPSGNECDADTQNDPSNCGACGHACVGQTCSCGTCQSACDGGLTACCGQCVDTTKDPQNCGTCKNQCLPPDNAIAACSMSACTFTCEPDAGLTECPADGGTAGCFDLMTSSQACGMCGKPCGTGDSCVGGKCVSSAGGYTTSTPKLPFVNACKLSGANKVLKNQSSWTPDMKTVTVPFSFTFFGTASTQVWLQSQGALGVGAFNPFADNYPDCMNPDPTTTYPAAVAFGEANLATGPSGVCYGSTPAGKGDGGAAAQFVVTWSGATLTSVPGSELTFSIVLTEGSNTVDFLYETATVADAGPSEEVEGKQATVGLQQSGSVNTPYQCYKAFLKSTPYAVRFTPH